MSPSESGRLAALQRYDIVGSPDEAAFDRITDLAALLLEAPMAGIHFVDDRCQWAKAQTGLDAKTMGLDVSFCARELGVEDLLVVEDAADDARFADNPLVTGEPSIRFYAGAALTTPDGHALGRLCVIDTAPRPEGLDERERSILEQLAGVVMDELEYRAQPRHREEVLESITDAFFAVDETWRFTYVNERAAELLQHSRTELLGENVWDRFPEAVELEFYDRYHRVMETEEPAEFEAYFPPLETWFSVKAYPLDGGVSVYFDDVTAQKEQEEEIRLLSRAVEEAAESVIITGPAIDEPGPRIEYVNPAFERMTGYTANEVIGKTPRILQGPKTHRSVLDAVRSHLKAGEPLTDTTTINYRKDGTPFWVEWNMAPVRGPDGQVEHWVSVQRDVTEGRQLRETLREREARFRLLFESNPLPMWVYDRETLRFLAVNQAAIARYGYSEDEFRAMTIADIRPQEDVERLMENLEGERPDLEHSGTWRHELKSGRVIDVDILSHTIVFEDRDAALVASRDVTEQRAAQETLRRQRNLLNQTQRLAGAWEYDLDTGIIDWSEEVYRIHEVPPGTTIPIEQGIDFYAPEAQPVIQGAVQEAIEERASWDLELPINTAKGNRRWVRSVGTPVVENGEVVKLAGAFQDVTARHDAQEKLYHSRERLARAQEIVELGSWERDFVHDTLFWSEETRRVFGWPADEPVTFDAFMEQVHPDDRPALRRAQKRVMAGQGDLDVEYRIRRPDGEERILHERGVADFDDDGMLLRVIGTVLDVTEQRAMEATLRRNEELFRSFAEQAVDVVALFEADGTFKYLSPSITAVTGYDREQLIGADGFAPVHPDDLPAVQSAFQEAVQNPGTTTEVEGRYQHQDGSWRHLSIRGRRLPTARSEVEVLANVRDVTEQKQAEKQIIQAKERAEEMSRLKSAFLANMSHEIRTPLTAILGFADVLRGMIEGEATELLDLIRSSGKRLEDTLTSVLDLAQLESDVMRLEAEPVDLRDEVRTAADLVRKQVKEKGLAMHVDAPEVPVRVNTDPKAFHRILSNLLSNAVKFTNEGHVRVALHPEAEEVIITVEDTGIGIAPDEVDRVFDEFAQESEGYTRAYEGVGLGLPITKRLTELLGGSIAVDSVKGDGTVFTVALPRKRSAEAERTEATEAADTPPASPTNNAPTTEPSGQLVSGDEVERAPGATSHRGTGRGVVRTLLVEDNAHTRQMLPLLMEQIAPSYEVDAAATFSEALETARASSYDLFIVDINLDTDRSGIEFMRELRAMPAYRAAPMIACTAYAMPGDEENLMDAGFDAYLAKPFNADELLNVLEEVAERPVQ
jgi:PAS domain S-box-containing protein